jgi:quinol monooxygenase YgiN
VYRVHRAKKDPELFMFYEMYADAAALDAHVKAPHFTAYNDRREREGLSDGALEFKIYRSLTE